MFTIKHYYYFQEYLYFLILIQDLRIKLERITNSQFYAILKSITFGLTFNKHYYLFYVIYFTVKTFP